MHRYKLRRYATTKIFRRLMSQSTPIEWCDSTVNPTSGCGGCELYNPHRPDEAVCYAKWFHERRLARNPVFKESAHYAPTFDEVRMIAGRVQETVKWSDLRGKARSDKPWLDGQPRRIFVGDLSDFASKGVTDDFIMEEIIAPMIGAPHLYMLVTKRPERLAKLSRLRPFPPNTEVLTSITGNYPGTNGIRAYHLGQIETWGLVRISAEPLRGEVNWNSVIDRAGAGNKLAGIIFGGESKTGPNHAAPCNVQWILDGIAACRKARIEPFVKQLGDAPFTSDPNDSFDYTTFGKKGKAFDQWPAALQVREITQRTK